jgi:2'-5' RNA ligase
MNDEERSQKIRSFIALELSDEVRGELSRILGLLKEANADVKWVRPESVHLTLKFLGYVPEGRIASLAQKLKEIAQSASPFEIVLDGIGIFPDWSHARVLWIGVGEGSDRVKDLASRVEEAMALEGFEKEKRSFSSHLTLGRIRGAKNKDELRKIASSIEVKPLKSHIPRIVLFKSVLTPKGAVYSPLSAAEFSR